MFRKPNRGHFGAGCERYEMMDRMTVKDIIEEYVKENKTFKSLKELYEIEYVGVYSRGSCLWSLSNFSRIFNEYNYQFKYNKTLKSWELKHV